MLRSRFLECDDTQLSLFSNFEPSSESNDLNEDRCCVQVVWHFHAASDQPVFEVLRHMPFPLPSVDLVQEEVNFVFSLLKSLDDHETSQTQKPEDFPALSY